MLADSAPAAKGNLGLVATLDIERIKGKFAGEFWSLNDMKGRRIPADWVVQDPRTILVCWAWNQDKTVHAAAEWDEDGHYGMLKRVWDVLDQADAIVGHNVGRFDLKNLHTEMSEHGMKPPRPVKVIDTLKIARAQFAFESNTLDSLCRRFNVARKVDHYDPDVAQRAVDGSVTDQRRMTRYCKGDVIASRELKHAMDGWNPSHPHLGPASDELRCNQCGTVLTADNRVGTRRAEVIDYPLYRCPNCGGNVQNTAHRNRVATTRGAR